MHRPTSSEIIPRAAVSGAIFQGERVLLVRRARPPALGLWSLPGGHIEPGETAADALLRELMEETGVKGRLGGVADAVDVIDCGPDVRCKCETRSGGLQAELVE